MQKSKKKSKDPYKILRAKAIRWALNNGYNYADSEDYAQKVLIEKFLKGSVNFHWVNADNLRVLYGRGTVDKPGNRKIALDNHLSIQHDLKSEDKILQLLVDEKDYLEKTVENRQVSELIINEIGKLSDRYQFIAIGILLLEMREKEISEIIGVSESRISQIKNTVINKIKKRVEFIMEQNLL